MIDVRSIINATRKQYETPRFWQAYAGTAAALAAGSGKSLRELAYGTLRDALEKDGVHFET